MKQLLFGIFIGALLVQLGTVIAREGETLEEEKIAALLHNSAATLVSPHNIRERMSYSKDDYILVDTRLQEDYEREHIVTAINIDSGVTWIPYFKNLKHW